MLRKYLPAIAHNPRESDSHSRQPIRYKLWTGQSISVSWNNANNWSSTGIPSGSSNVLFAGNQKIIGECQIDSDIVINKLFVRSDYNGAYITTKAGKNLTFKKEARFDSDAANLSFNTNNITLQSGAALFDTPQFVSWGNSVFNLSGDLIIYGAASVGDFGHYKMLGSGKTLQSNVALGHVLFNNYTNVDNGVNVVRTCVVSGIANLNNTLTINGTNGILRVAPSGSIEGVGDLIIQNNAYVAQQDGYIGSQNMIVQNCVGETLAPSLYSVKNMIFRNPDSALDRVVFQDGDYTFRSNVFFIATGGGVLEVNNQFYNSHLFFEKNIDIIYNETSRVDWKAGTNKITLFHPIAVSGHFLDIQREFNRFQDGRGAVNVCDNCQGMALSEKNVLFDQNVLWVVDSTGMGTTPLSIQAILDAGHHLGTLQFANFTGQQVSALSANEGLIYAADVGDSGSNRDSIIIYRCTEPTITGFGFFTATNTRTISGSYETGTNIPSGEQGTNSRDVQAMFVHNPSNLIFLITNKTNPAQIFSMTGASIYVGHQTFPYLGQMKFGSGIVGADMSQDGREIIFKTYDKTYYYRVDGTGVNDVVYSLTGTNPVEILDYIPDYRERGISWSSGASSFYTLATFNPDLHDHALRSPFYHYDRRAHINFTGLNVEDIVIRSHDHEKRLISSLNTRSLSLESGVLNLNGQHVRTSGGFYAGPDSNFIRGGFNGARIQVSGDFLVVGTAINRLSMHPDSGLGEWQLQVGGSARAYYANVRASHASGGNTVYGYNSADFTFNRNWVFPGLASISGNMPLYIAGFIAPSLTGQVPLYIYGKTGDSTGLLNLYLAASPTGIANKNLNLYLSASPTINSGIPIMICNSGAAGTVQLYIRGKEATGVLLNVFLQQDGVQGSINLFCLGHEDISGGLPLSIYGSSPVSSGVELSIFGQGPVDRNLKLYINGKHL